MKNNFSLTLILLASFALAPGLFAQPQVTVNVQQSAGGCGLATNCANGVICVDIVMTVNQTKTLDSYNIWVEYDGSVISREAFNVNNNTPVGDNTCVIANGVQDTDLEGPSFNPDHWRVAGVPGNGFPMTANIPYVVHTICFMILNPSALNGQSVCVGGNVSSLLTTVTFTDATSDTNVPETCMVLNSSFNTCSLLPIELLSFNASPVGNTSLLEWVTSSEVNNKLFEVQRADRNNQFISIGNVNAAGTSAIPTSYQFTDKNPQDGFNYYRLKQVDFDGKFTFSPVRSVSFSRQVAINLFPNPVSEMLYVTLSQPNIPNEKIEFDIFDADGRLVDSGNILSNFQTIDVSKHQPGVYVLSIKSDALNTKEKFIIANN